MSFNPADLEALAGSLLQKGLPALGALIGGPAGAVVGNIAASLVPQIAGAFGLAPDTTPAVVAATVASDPNASTKLATLEDAQKNALAWAHLQVEQNKDELTVDGPAWLKFFYGGWRPTMGWISGPILVAYQIAASAAHLPLIPDGLLAWITPIWVGLAGLRTYERAQGVALDTLPIRKK
jgi:hypothetical protein